MYRRNFYDSGNRGFQGIVGSQSGKILAGGGDSIVIRRLSKLGQGGLVKRPGHPAFKNYFFFLRYATHHFR